MSDLARDALRENVNKLRNDVKDMAIRIARRNQSREVLPEHVTMAQELLRAATPTPRDVTQRPGFAFALGGVLIGISFFLATVARDLLESLGPVNESTLWALRMLLPGLMLGVGIFLLGAGWVRANLADDRTYAATRTRRSILHLPGFAFALGGMLVGFGFFATSAARRWLESLGPLNDHPIAFWTLVVGLPCAMLAVGLSFLSAGWIRARL